MIILIMPQSDRKAACLHPEVVHRKIELNINKRLKKKRKFALLKLRNHKIPQIPLPSKILIQSLKHLKTLNISQAGLLSLVNFPVLPDLLNLDLTMNKISDDSIKYILPCESLRMIYLTENKVKFLSSLYPLSDLKFLNELDISQNLFTYTIREVFLVIPQVKIVDRFNSDFRDLQSLNFSSSQQEDGENPMIKRKKSQSEYSEVIFTPEQLIMCETVPLSLMNSPAHHIEEQVKQNLPKTENQNPPESLQIKNSRK